MSWKTPKSKMRTKLIRLIRNNAVGTPGFILRRGPDRFSTVMAKVPDNTVVQPIWEDPFFFWINESLGRFVKIIYGEEIGYIEGDLIQSIFVLTDDEETGEIKEKLLWGQ